MAIRTLVAFKRGTTIPSIARKRKRYTIPVAAIAIGALPIVPMPIAGGTPFLLALLGFLLLTVALTWRPFPFSTASLQFLLLCVLLLLTEVISAFFHRTEADFLYVYGRIVWVSTAFLLVVVVAQRDAGERSSILISALTIGLVFLLTAMMIEMLFFPKRELGRDYGWLTFYLPRATGVPNSGGKIGTFLCICFAVGLFCRPFLTRFQKIVLLVGPILGFIAIQGRSTLLALTAVGMVYLIFTAVRKLHRGRVGLSIIPLVVIFMMGLMSADKLADKLIGEGIWERNAVSRISTAQYGIQTLAEYPVFGAGASATREDPTTAGIHNTLLAMGVKSGLLASLTMALIIIFPLYVSVRFGVSAIFFAGASTVGIFIEHLFYPGIINEFLIIHCLVVFSLAPLVSRNRLNRSSSHFEHARVSPPLPFGLRSR